MPSVKCRVALVRAWLPSPHESRPRLPEGEPEVADDVAQDGEDDEGRDGQADL